MTHYWWMHWFWITLYFSATCSKNISIHSSPTEYLPLNKSSESNRTTKATEACPLNTTISSTSKKHTQPLTLKSIFPSTKKTTSVIAVNSSDYDNQLLNTTTFIVSNHSDNITYVEEETRFNQSLLKLSDLTSVEDTSVSNGTFSAAGITGITLGCVVIVGMLSGLSYFIYRNRGLNQPQVLNDRCSNPDSSGYIDDASVRDNSEEMYSLDNDSFLNSLEAMTIQNYWTDTVKHTKL